MTLPRFRLPEEDEDVDMDATAPAQFVLSLPKSFARRLAQPTPMSFAPFTPPPPWTVEAEPPRASTRHAGLVIALLATVLAGVLVIATVGTATAAAHGPVGIAHRAPKSLDEQARSSSRTVGVAPRVHPTTVSIDSLARPRRAAHHRATWRARVTRHSK
ncbi:MAG TPA: hypothetical protein VGH28_33605 [Polyangiaceae bacterium]|jgi:hypothetical protein